MQSNVRLSATFLASSFALLALVATSQGQQPLPTAGTPQIPDANPGGFGPITGVPGQPPVGPHPQAAQAFVGPPFQLSPVEQQYVDQILQEWEDRGADVKTFDCEFERWEYDPVFGPGTEEPAIKSHGRLTYSKPDKGSFKIERIFRYQKSAEGQPPSYALQEHEIGEHWVCDGKAIYSYKHEKKQLVEQRLPPEMRGKEIVKGPLPFLFGAKAEELKSRYWIRTKQSNASTIWIEAYPRRQEDAANYHHVEVMLARKTMLPEGIQVHMPNGNSRAVYIFQTPTVNGTMDQLFGGLFSSPRTPIGWRKVVMEAPQTVNPGAPGPQAAAPAGTKLQ